MAFTIRALCALLALSLPPALLDGVSTAGARAKPHSRHARAKPHKRVRKSRAASSPSAFASFSPAVAAATPSGSMQTEPPPYSPPFAPDSIWNAPVPSGAPVDPHSTAYIADLQRQLQSWDPWINTLKWSSPVYSVPGNQPTVKVTLRRGGPDDLKAALNAVPLPSNAKPSNDDDSTLILVQPSTDTLWEFWSLQRNALGWSAGWGGRMQHVSQSPGYYDRWWGASASGLSWLGGLIRPSELAAGHIDHALALAIPEPRANYYSSPADRTDGTLDSPDAIPEGAHLRLDPALDLSSIAMPRVTRIVAEAAQRYGIWVRDRAGAVTFFAEDTTPSRTDPYGGANGFFEGKWPSQLLQSFPWSRLQVLPTHLHSN
jgi:hypothetical protein